MLASIYEGCNKSRSTMFKFKNSLCTMVYYATTASIDIFNLPSKVDHFFAGDISSRTTAQK
jgi:CRISPR/Cas system CMR-associated protein Cmr3 (group 5 of RAMP superfamily)